MGRARCKHQCRSSPPWCPYAHCNTITWSHVNGPNYCNTTITTSTCHKRTRKCHEYHETPRNKLHFLEKKKNLLPTGKKVFLAYAGPSRRHVFVASLHSSNCVSVCFANLNHNNASTTRLIRLRADCRYKSSAATDCRLCALSFGRCLYRSCVVPGSNIAHSHWLM